MIGAPPFRFERQGSFLVDEANGLRLHCYHWPEYHYTIALEPLSGEQAEAWPLSQRAYYEFGTSAPPPDQWLAGTIDFAVAHIPFERDFPGRSEDLLDVILPLVAARDLFSFPEASRNLRAGVSHRLRTVLQQSGRYSRHRDDSTTPQHPLPSKSSHGDVLRTLLRKLFR